MSGLCGRDSINEGCPYYSGICERCKQNGLEKVMNKRKEKHLKRKNSNFCTISFIISIHSNSN